MLRKDLNEQGNNMLGTEETINLAPVLKHLVSLTWLNLVSLHFAFSFSPTVHEIFACRETIR